MYPWRPLDPSTGYLTPSERAKLRALQLPAPPPPPKRHRPAHVGRFLTMAVPAAQEVSQKYHIPVSVILAQSAHETQWGQVVKGNAYFGVKGATGTAGGLAFGTHEDDAHGHHAVKQTFRAFHNYAEAADDYGSLIARKYPHALLRRDDPYAVVDSIAAGHYATDPAYATKVKAVIRSQHLTDFDSKIP